MMIGDWTIFQYPIIPPALLVNSYKEYGKNKKQSDKTYSDGEKLVNQSQQ